MSKKKKKFQPKLELVTTGDSKLKLDFDKGTVNVVKVRKISTTIQLPVDIITALDSIKAKYGSSRNFVIEQALRQYLNLPKKD